MKKMGIIAVLLVLLINGFVFAQSDEGVCTVFISGKPGNSTAVTVEIKSFNTDTGKLKIRVNNRLGNEDIEIVKVEVNGLNARRNKVQRIFTLDEIEMDDEYDGIIPRKDRVDIEIRGITIMRSVSSVIVYADVCKF